MQQAQELSYRRFLGYAALAVGVALVPVLLWQLGSILILGFGAILIAILLHVVSEPLQRWTPLPEWADLLIAGLILLALVALGGWIFWSQLSGEFGRHDPYHGARGSDRHRDERSLPGGGAGALSRGAHTSVRPGA